ncbi:MAG TPA: hypothetical protein VMT56_03895 [Candidatus Bathyarchaeia archaeon]|nr:hypothetical protein [Candidatus Bathyarchaeia archaeon]
MARARRRLLLGCGVVTLLGILWVVRVELTFERNIRRGIPADFRIHNRHRPVNWTI